MGWCDTAAEECTARERCQRASEKPRVWAWLVRAWRRREAEWQSVRERDRGRGKCLPFCMPLKERIVPGVPLRMPTSKPSPGHHLAAASIDHLQSFIPPIKILSVHITFVFLCWTLLLLHKDTLKECLWIWCIFPSPEEIIHWKKKKTSSVLVQLMSTYWKFQHLLKQK